MKLTLCVTDGASKKCDICKDSSQSLPLRSSTLNTIHITRYLAFKVTPWPTSNRHFLKVEIKEKLYFR